MLRWLYDWMLDLASRRQALQALGVLGFLESSIFPIPVDVMIVPMVLAKRGRAWMVGAVATVASVAGGLAGFGIGLFLFEAVGQPLLDFYGYGDRFTQFQDLYREWGAWIVVAGAMTPIPYKVVTIASGVVAMDVVVFTVASILSRGVRFFGLAGMIYLFGPSIRDLLERRFGLVMSATFALMIAGFFAIKMFE
ncbi:MAG: YqaA family protein [Alphaproteobacteria bacterium]|nr:YqaA family protein [Alphaproteobacteria bacterium]